MTDTIEQGTALLVMDFQERIVGMVADSAPLIERMRVAIEAAHKAQIPVIYILVRFREGYPEVSARNKSFGALKSGAMPLTEDSPDAQVFTGLAPIAGDIVVTKRRVSAFAGSDLEVVLRGLNVDQLILAGIATSGVVLSTLREAADKDYSLTVLSDACADMDEEVQRVLLTKVFPRQADVLTVAEWSSSLTA
jgi:nicotinamidase-related amidase